MEIVIVIIVCFSILMSYQIGLYLASKDMREGLENCKPTTPEAEIAQLKKDYGARLDELQKKQTDLDKRMTTFTEDQKKAQQDIDNAMVMEGEPDESLQ